MTQREWADKNYYADLGVSSSATADEIKRAYRKLARDNHPDKHPGDKVAEERFKKVAEAYDVLGDDKKRKEYDELKDLIASGGIPGFGSGGFGGNSTGFGGGFRQAADFDVSDLFGGGRGGFSSDGSSFSDIFGGLFNRGGSGGGSPTQHGPTHEGSGRGSGYYSGLPGSNSGYNTAHTAHRRGTLYHLPRLWIQNRKSDGLPILQRHRVYL